jgi:hypothetical protein
VLKPGSRWHPQARADALCRDSRSRPVARGPRHDNALDLGNLGPTGDRWERRPRVAGMTGFPVRTCAVVA